VLSVIIPTLNSVQELEALFAALVPGAVDGLVREVLLADGGSTDGTAALCEDAGATMVQGGLAEVAAAARHDAVLVLPPDLRLPYDWIRKLTAHQVNGGGPAIIEGMWRRPRWFGPSIGAIGLLMSREQLMADGRRGLPALRRRLRRPVRID